MAHAPNIPICTTLSNPIISTSGRLGPGISTAIIMRTDMMKVKRYFIKTTNGDDELTINKM